MPVARRFFNIPSDVICPNLEDDSLRSISLVPSELPLSVCRSLREMKYSKTDLSSRERTDFRFKGINIRKLVHVVLPYFSVTFNDEAYYVILAASFNTVCYPILR